ncbi:MAG: nitroreductase family protein [Pseudonocardia sp.]|nr:nitroreductase family protein [Pseudonocardia sp.]MBO0872038.1 nitroreductase family protein [Pseudonocardia sp.]
MDATLKSVGGLTAEQVRTVLTAATAAPSLHNSQPWRFRCTPSAFEVRADLSRAVPIADPDHRELVLACGAALFNLRMAIRALGVYPDAQLYPDPNRPSLLATVRPQGTRRATPAERRLVDAIHRRRTNRRQFTDALITEPVRNELRSAAEMERSWLAVLAPAQLPPMRQLVARAHDIQQRDAAFVAEWAWWTAREQDAEDGVPLRSAGPLPEPQDTWVLRDFSAGRGRERVAGKDFEAAPLIAVVGSFHDLPLARLQAGQAMQRVLLTATLNGLSTSFLSQVVEVPQTRKQLRELIGGGLWPQTVLRIGYGSPVPRTPRRKIGDVVDLSGEATTTSPIG